MKRSLLSISAIVVLSAQVKAQITIAEPDFGTFVNTTDRTIKATANSFVAFPLADHINQPRPTGYTWNIDAVYGDTTTGAVFHRHVSTTGYEYADSSMDGFGTTFQFPCKVLTDITATGIIQSGERITRRAYSLASLIGANPLTDSLIVLEQDAMYFNPGFVSTPAPRTVLELPATLATGWSNNFYFKVKAAFTYAIQGYVDDTLERRRYVVDDYSVIGYGTMRVRNHVVPYPWSQYNSVLQTRANFIQVKDSFFINNVPADSAELSYFNLTQGVQTIAYRDLFYRTGEVIPFVAVHYTDAGRATIQNAVNDRSQIHTDRVPLSISEVMSNNSYAIFPNPVKGGGTLNIDLKDNSANGKWSYNLINISGQEVAVGNLNLSGGKTNITLPQLPTGIYYIQATNGDSKIVKAMEIE